MQQKILYFTLFAIFLVAMMMFPIASADDGNVTSVTTPYITINPIGNHTIDEVFFINGTTNLPADNASLLITIETTNFNPGGAGSFFTSNVSIQPGENGVNFWSCNATTSLWETWLGPVPDAIPGQYLIMVNPTSPLQVYQQQLFFILPSENSSRNIIPPSHTPPVAVFGYGYGETTPSKTASVTVDFMDESQNSPTSWLWSFGDGNSSTSQNPHYTYPNAGTYTVFLTATNGAGSNTTRMTVNIPTVNEVASTLIATQTTPPVIPATITTQETILVTPTPKAGLNEIPVLGALVLCGVLFLFKMNRK